MEVKKEVIDLGGQNSLKIGAVYSHKSLHAKVKPFVFIRSGLSALYKIAINSSPPPLMPRVVCNINESVENAP